MKIDDSWSAAITSCKAVGVTGAKRLLNGAFAETLVEHNDGTYTMRYSIVNGPSPASAGFKDYISTLQLRPITHDNATLAEWTSAWKSDDDAAVKFCAGIYNARAAQRTCRVSRRLSDRSAPSAGRTLDASRD